ncbi:MAG: hypothetical protein H6833_04940 [Planctomycetes bacterium]|nr:hypothetical protein [Planctomycetota bacterium]
MQNPFVHAKDEAVATLRWRVAHDFNNLLLGVLGLICIATKSASKKADPSRDDDLTEDPGWK